MSIFVCPHCSKQIDLDFHSEDVYDDGENDPICLECHEDYVDKEMRYWWSLYKGEKVAGLHEGLTEEEMRELK